MANDRLAEVTQHSELSEGDRVEVCLHGATMPNDAKGTIVDDSPVSILTDAVIVELDNNHRHCDNLYETSRSSVTKIDAKADTRNDGGPI